MIVLKLNVLLVCPVSLTQVSREREHEMSAVLQFWKDRTLMRPTRRDDVVVSRPK